MKELKKNHREFVHQMFKFDERVSARMNRRNCNPEEYAALSAILGTIEDYYTRFVF